MSMGYVDQGYGEIWGTLSTGKVVFGVCGSGERWGMEQVDRRDGGVKEGCGKVVKVTHERGKVGKRGEDGGVLEKLRVEVIWNGGWTCGELSCRMRRREKLDAAVECWTGIIHLNLIHFSVLQTPRWIQLLQWIIFFFFSSLVIVMHKLTPSFDKSTILEASKSEYETPTPGCDTWRVGLWAVPAPEENITYWDNSNISDKPCVIEKETEYIVSILGVAELLGDRVYSISYSEHFMVRNPPSLGGNLQGSTDGGMWPI